MSRRAPPLRYCITSSVVMYCPGRTVAWGTGRLSLSPGGADGKGWVMRCFLIRDGREGETARRQLSAAPAGKGRSALSRAGTRFGRRQGEGGLVVTPRPLR